MNSDEEKEALLLQTPPPALKMNDDFHASEESSQLLNDNRSYHASSSSDDGGDGPTTDHDELTHPTHPTHPNLPLSSPIKILLNFILFSILFSTNHGAVVSCLSLATARLGNLGTTQNSCLYLSYTLSALFGSTYVIKTIGSYYSIIVGMFIYFIYILSYVIATIVDGNERWGWMKDVAIIGGGLIGGIGGGFLWTAQGTFFAKEAQKYGILNYRYHSVQRIRSRTDENGNSSDGDDEEEEESSTQQQQSISNSTSLFAGIFACIYLLVEVIMRLSSSFMIEILNWTWTNVFAGYAIVAISVTLGMFLVQNGDHDESNTQSTLEESEGNYVAPTYHHQEEMIDIQQQEDTFDSNVSIEDITNQQRQPNDEKQSAFYKATITFRMLINDPKMKYMIPMCAVFGLSAVFINTFVNGEVLRISLHDNKSIYVGILSSITSGTAGILSIIFGFVAQRIGNGIVLFIGCAGFFMVAFLFLVIPDLEVWNLPLLVVVYIMQGVGRSTFEGALKAEFAIVFAEKEGAFGNIIFQNGLVTTIGFYLAANMYCEHESTYCIEYSDGRYHDVLTLELLVVGSAILAVFGYARAKWMYLEELKQQQSSLRRNSNLQLVLPSIPHENMYSD